MKYLSICSGIEAASVAWHPLGWKPLAFSEIEPFPRAVLAHHYPHVPLHGDFTTLRDQPWIVDADVLVGGTPCQAFSVAGLRNSLSDERGNLSLEFVRLADAIDDLRLAGRRDPAIIVWENVPGVLSVKDNAFGCFLAALAGDVTPIDPPRGKWTNAGVVDGPARSVAWRVLDAQYFGLAQRRRRVFVVASARDGLDPAAVLLEWEGVRRDTPPRREAGQVAPIIPSRSTAGGGLGTDFDLDGGVIRQTTEMLADTLSVGANQTTGFNSPSVVGVASKWPADIAPTLNASFGKKQGLEDQHIRGGVASSCPPISLCLNAGGMGRCDAETETLIATTGGVFDVAVDVCTTLRAGGNQTGGDRPPGTDVDTADSLIVTHTLKGEGFDASEDGTGRGTPLVPVAFHPTQDPISSTDGSTHALGCGSKGGQASVAVAVPLQEVGKRTGVSTDDPRAGIGIGQDGDPMYTLQAGAQHGVAVEPYTLAIRGRGDTHNLEARQDGLANALLTPNGGRAGIGVGAVAAGMAVRRLTPVECERLQGFPDGYTNIPWRNKPEAPDGPRYKALGNSMAVPVMAWIGRRIKERLA